MGRTEEESLSRRTANIAFRCPISVPWVLLLGVVLRLAFLATKPFQIDECWTYFVATDEATLWDNTTFEAAFDSHPFLFYVLYRWLAPLITASEWLFRLPVALFSILALFAYRMFLARTELSQGMKDWSLLLFAVLPANVFYAYDARSYSLAQLVGIGVMYFYLVCQRRQPNQLFKSSAGGLHQDSHLASERSEVAGSGQPTSGSGRPQVWRGASAWLHRLGSRVHVARGGLALCVGLSCTFDVIGLSPVLAVGLDSLYCFVQNQSRARAARNLVTILVGGLLAIPYALFRWQQHLATGQADALVKPFHPVTFIDNLTQLSPFGVGRLHADALPGGLAVYWLICAATICILLAGAWRAVRLREPDHRLFWFLVLPPFLGQLVFLWFSGGVPLHRRYLMVIVAGLVPIMVFGVRELLGLACFRAGRLTQPFNSWPKRIHLPSGRSGVAGVNQSASGWGRAPTLVSISAWNHVVDKLVPVVNLVTLFLIPLTVSLVMSARLGTRPDWRTMYGEIGAEFRETDGIIHPYSSPAPGFVVSPVVVYASMQGKQVSRENFLEPRIHLEHLAQKNDRRISLADPKDWATEQDYAETLRFVEAFAGGRIWTFATPLTENRDVDLAPRAELLETWSAPGLRARLYEVSPGSKP